MRIPTQVTRLAWGYCIIAGVAGAPICAHAAFTPFTSVEVTTDDGVIAFERATASDFAQVGSSPALFAKGRASFGETGAFAIATEQQPHVGAYAETSWSDAFTIFGGAGTGILRVSTQVQGTFTGAGAPGGPGPNSIYALFASDSPITLGQNSGGGLLGFLEDGTTTPPDGSTTVIGVFESIVGSHIFTAEIPFTYGTAFYIASYLGAEVLGQGTADFFGSARFGATAPGGASVTGASGTTYALAAAVPEPASYAAMIAGLLTLAFAMRSRRNVRTEMRSP